MLSIVGREINPDFLNVKVTLNWRQLMRMAVFRGTAGDHEETGAREKSKIILKTLQEWHKELKLG